MTAVIIRERLIVKLRRAGAKCEASAKSRQLFGRTMTVALVRLVATACRRVLLRLHLPQQRGGLGDGSLLLALGSARHEGQREQALLRSCIVCGSPCQNNRILSDANECAPSIEFSDMARHILTQAAWHTMAS